MFYINYINIKNSKIDKLLSMLISIGLSAISIIIFKNSLYNFCVGGNIKLIEYLYVICVVYLLSNIYIAFKKESKQINTSEVLDNKVIEEKNHTEKINNNVIIVNKTIVYKQNTRASIIPDFGNDGLEFVEEELELEEPNETKELENFESITFQQEDNNINNEIIEAQKEEVVLSKAERQNLLKNDLYSNKFGK